MTDGSNSIPSIRPMGRNNFAHPPGLIKAHESFQYAFNNRFIEASETCIRSTLQKADCFYELKTMAPGTTNQSLSVKPENSSEAMPTLPKGQLIPGSKASVNVIPGLWEQ